MGLHLEAAEVLQPPQLDGAVGRRAGQHLIHGGELDAPDAPPVAPEHPQQGEVRQGPELRRAVLGARGHQLVVRGDAHTVHVLE